MGKKGGDSLQGTKKEKEERFSFERQLATTKWKPPAQKLSCYWYCLVHVHGEKWGESVQPARRGSGGEKWEMGGLHFFVPVFLLVLLQPLSSREKKGRASSLRRHLRTILEKHLLPEAPARRAGLRDVCRPRLGLAPRRRAAHKGLWEGDGGQGRGGSGGSGSCGRGGGGRFLADGGGRGVGGGAGLRGE